MRTLCLTRITSYNVCYTKLLRLIIGLALIFIEFLVLPGTNIAGVIGIVLIISGIIFSYRDIGVPVAHYVLGGTFIFLILSIVFLLRSNTRNNFV